MDLDRLYIQDLLDTATRGLLAEQPGSTPDGGTNLDEPIITSQALGEEGDDPEGGDPQGDIPVDELPFTSGPADDVQNPTVTTQSLGEEGDDPEDDLTSDTPFDVESDSDDSDDDDSDHESENIEFGDDDFSDDDFGLG